MQSNPNPSKNHIPHDEDNVKYAVPPVATVEIPEPAPVVKQVETPANPVQVRGVVTDCLKLNVRSTPKSDPSNANVLGTIECLTGVLVDEAASTDDFYKVQTESGLEGFCMKKYIAVERPQ